MTHRSLTTGLLALLAWTCCLAQPAGFLTVQDQTIRQGVAYITYPVVAGPKSATLNAKIQDWIGNNCDLADGSHAGLKDCLASLANYCAGPAGGGDAPDSTCEDSIEAKVVMNSDGFLVVELNHFSHANMEPHGNWLLEYLNLDVSSGRTLLLSDLLDSHYEPTLEQMLVRALREQWSGPEGKTPTEIGLWTNDPGIPRQFEITPTGLLFTYQVGDLGPNAFGNIGLPVPYTELSNLIRKDGPLERILNPSQQATRR